MDVLTYILSQLDKTIKALKILLLIIVLICFYELIVTILYTTMFNIIKIIVCDLIIYILISL
jgi:hypothetical protein